MGFFEQGEMWDNSFLPG